MDVAIKTVKSSAEQERVKLLQEAAIMGQFAHSNVVRLHGVVTVGDPVCRIYRVNYRDTYLAFGDYGVMLCECYRVNMVVDMLKRRLLGLKLWD